MFTICRSSMRAFTPASISFLSWGVSGHGYSVALKLKTEEAADMWLWQETPSDVASPATYPSQIFFTLFFS